MSFPTLRAIVKFIFHHDQWLEEQEALEFHRMVETMAKHHHITEVPRVKWLLEHSDEWLQKLRNAQYNWRFWLLVELDFDRLVQIDHGSRRIDIPERYLGGRFIPVQELFDHVIRWRGEPESITIDGSGMVVQTDAGYGVSFPNCVIYLHRLNEDGLRYENATIFTEHVTGGTVQLDWKELAGHTDHIVVERDGDSWKVDTGLPVTT